MLELSSTEDVFFFSTWFILCCHGSTGHEIGGRGSHRYVKKDLRLFVYCLRALTHPGEISHVCGGLQRCLSVNNVRRKQPIQKARTVI